MKKFYAAVGISTVLATGLGGCAASNGVVASAAPTDPYSIGKENFAAGQFGLAVESFQKALDSQGPSVDRLNALGATYDHLSRFDLADRAYRQALVLDPKSPQTLNNIGYSYLLRGRADLASAYLAKAQSLAKGDARIGANLALAAQKLEQPPAVLHASAAVAEQPTPISALPTANEQMAPVAAPAAAIVTLVTPQQDTYIEPVAHGVYRLITTNLHMEGAWATTAISSGTITIPQVSEPMPTVAAVPVSAVEAEPIAAPQNKTVPVAQVQFSAPAAPVAGIIQVAATASDMQFSPEPVAHEQHVASPVTSVQLPIVAEATAGIIGMAAPHETAVSIAPVTRSAATAADPTASFRAC